MAEPDLGGLFRQPFPEQLAAYRLRLGNLFPTRAWDDLENRMHDRAFMVAGAMKADLLEDLAGAVDRVIAEGIGLEEFKKDFFGIAEKHGWRGWTGDGTKAGRHWRARVIYRTNLRSTYAAGRLAQLRKAGFKYWVYRHGGSLDPRPEHLSWDGLVLPSDHPFWATHYPPNGWGCSCYIVGTNSLAGARRLGGNPDLKLPDGWDRVNTRSGAPHGIDRGWDYQPGASVSDLISALTPKVKLLADQPAVDLIQSWLQVGAFADWLKRPDGFWPLARIRTDEATRLGVTRPTVFISPETISKQLRVHGELSISEYQLVQRILDAPTERIIEDARNTIYVLVDPNDRNYTLVIKAVVNADELLITSFRRLSSDTAKLRRELSRLRSRRG